jgi:hypothetical protein
LLYFFAPGLMLGNSQCWKDEVTSCVIDGLLNAFSRQPNNEILAYIYFSRNNPQCNNIAAALYILIRQLSTTPKGTALQ